MPEKKANLFYLQFHNNNRQTPACTEFAEQSTRGERATPKENLVDMQRGHLKYLVEH